MINLTTKEKLDMLNSISFEDIDNQFMLDQQEYNIMIKKLNILNEETENTKQKGDKLEELLIYILEKSGIFKCTFNKRTSTNEIDVRAAKTQNFITFENRYDINIENIIYFECKNYNQRLGVTYIGKFFSVLNVSGIKLGVVISPFGLTGTGWSDGNGLCKKLFLKNNIDIISITKEDLMKLNNESLMNIIQRKIQELREDMDLKECFQQTHDLMEENKKYNVKSSFS